MSTVNTTSFPPFMRAAANREEGINQDVCMEIMAHYLPIGEGTVVRALNRSWQRAFDLELTSLWNKILLLQRQNAPSQSLANRIFCINNANIPIPEALQKLNRFFLDTYGAGGIDFTQNLRSLSEQVKKLSIREQRTHNHSLCKMWWALHQEVSAAFAPPLPTAPADQIRSWMNDPEQAPALESITELCLSDLSLPVLPPEIKILTQLQELHCSDNLIHQLPEEIGNLKHLRVLIVDSNQLSMLSKAVSMCTQLRDLHLCNNHLHALPEEIGRCTQLQTLHLYGNFLEALPGAMTALTHLQELSLDDNQFTVLPDMIKDFTQLTELTLSGNRITAIPKEAAQLQQLREFDISGNSIVFIPQDLLNSDQDILRQNRVIRGFRRILSYQCHCQMAKLCQGLMKEENNHKLRRLFLSLSFEEQERILHSLNSLAGQPATADTRWVELRMWDNKELLMWAVFHAIKAYLTTLPQDVCTAISQEYCLLVTPFMELTSNKDIDGYYPILADATATVMRCTSTV